MTLAAAKLGATRLIDNLEDLMSARMGFPANVQYVGFWARIGAALIDSVLLLMIIAPLLYWFYGPGVLRRHRKESRARRPAAQLGASRHWP